MNKIIVLFGSVLALISCKDTATQASENTKINPGQARQIRQIDSLIQRLVTAQHTAGVSFGIRIGHHEPFFAAYGMADMENNTKVHTASLFNVASVTKPFTALAIARLVQEGKLSFEDPISKFFPDFPKGDHITLYQLLSHTSGIPDWWIGGLPEDASGEWTVEPHPHRVLQQMKTTSLFEPGTKHFYSNSGYLLLGEIMEHVTGKSYQEYIKHAILNKYGAARSFIEEKGMNRDSLWTKGYGITIIDSVQNKKNFSPYDFKNYHLKSFGGLKSNPADLLQISNTLFEGAIVKKSILDSMISYAKTSNGNYVYDELFVPEGSQPPELPEHVERSGYGLGFNLMTTYGVPVIWHSGGMPGYNAIWAYFPNSGTTLVMLANTDNGLIPEYENIMKICAEIEL